MFLKRDIRDVKLPINLKNKNPMLHTICYCYHSGMLNILCALHCNINLDFLSQICIIETKIKKRKVLLKLISSKNKLFEKVLGFHTYGSIIFAFAKEYLNRSFKVASFLLLV